MGVNPSPAADVSAIKDQLAVFAAAEPRIVACYLFGSRARGDATAASDVDVAALFGETVALDDLLRLEDALERKLGLPVDLIDLGRANAFLALDVIRGECVYCTDEDHCDDFELYVMRRAGDLLPFERERLRLVLQP